MCNVLRWILIHCLALLLYCPSVSLSLMSICSKQAGRRRDEVDSLALCSPELSRNGKTQSCTNTLHVYLLSREREETEVLNLKSSQQDLCKDQNCLKLPTKVCFLANLTTEERKRSLPTHMWNKALKRRCHSKKMWGWPHIDYISSTLPSFLHRQYTMLILRIFWITMMIISSLWMIFWIFDLDDLFNHCWCYLRSFMIYFILMAFCKNFARCEISRDIFPILWYFAGVRQAFCLCWLWVALYGVALTKQAASQNVKTSLG